MRLDRAPAEWPFSSCRHRGDRVICRLTGCSAMQVQWPGSGPHQPEWKAGICKLLMASSQARRRKPWHTLCHGESMMKSMKWKFPASMLMAVIVGMGISAAAYDSAAITGTGSFLNAAGSAHFRSSGAFRSQSDIPMQSEGRYSSVPNRSAGLSDNEEDQAFVTGTGALEAKAVWISAGMLGVGAVVFIVFPLLAFQIIGTPGATGPRRGTSASRSCCLIC